MGSGGLFSFLTTIKKIQSFFLCRSIGYELCWWVGYMYSFTKISQKRHSQFYYTNSGVYCWSVFNWNSQCWSWLQFFRGNSWCSLCIFDETSRWCRSVVTANHWSHLRWVWTHLWVRWTLTIILSTLGRYNLILTTRDKQSSNKNGYWWVRNKICTW